MFQYRILVIPLMDAAGGWRVTVFLDDGPSVRILRMPPTDSRYLPDLLEDARRRIMLSFIHSPPAGPGSA